MDRAARRGVVMVVNVGIDQATSRASVDLAQADPRIYAVCGIHPHNARRYSERSLDWLESMALEPRVVAIGEIGLDYYRDRSPRSVQREVFTRQLELAEKMRLPVVVHSRQAEEDTFALLDQHLSPGHPVLLHCFSGDWECAQESLGKGYHLALGGPVTFRNAREAQEVAARVPLERLLLETDCPYLAPHPYRGKRNEPSYIPLVAGAIAQLRGESLESVARATTGAAVGFFGLELSGVQEG